MDEDQTGEDVGKLLAEARSFGTKEVAHVLDVLPSNVDRQPGLPEPREILPLSKRRLWDPDKIRDFAADRQVRRSKEEA